MRLFALVMLSLCSTQTCNGDISECPDGCECLDWKGFYVSCTDIDNLPLFPGNTETLRLYETQLSSITRDAFINMVNISLIEIADNIYMTEIPANALQGLTSDVLTVYLHRNTKLTDLSEDMFAGTLSGPVLLDISDSGVTSLPARGLESLRELIARNVWALKQLPPIKTFRHLIGADLTYPSHCCAFKNLKKRKSYLEYIICNLTEKHGHHNKRSLNTVPVPAVRSAGEDDEMSDHRFGNLSEHQDLLFLTSLHYHDFLGAHADGDVGFGDKLKNPQVAASQDFDSHYDYIVSLDEVQNKYNEAMQTIRNQEGLQRDLESEINGQQEIIQDLEEELSEIKSSCSIATAEMGRLSRNLSDLDSKWNLLNDTVLTNYSELSEDHLKLFRQYNELKEEHDKLQEITQVEAVAAFKQLMVSNAQLEKEKSKLMYHLHKLKGRVRQLEEMLYEADITCVVLKQDRERAEEAYSILMSQYRETFKQRNELLKASLAETEKKLRRAAESGAQLSYVNILRSSVQKWEKELSEICRRCEKRTRERRKKQEEHTILKTQYNEIMDILKQCDEFLKNHHSDLKSKEPVVL
ncbi:Thyrotropin receptor [Bagarius yarrelli]|uniref:Thyrotropin receptor n=1 Tax=Bagarius yarrelli TaxID=175774 RepID=A0A556TZP7_BAGYA|nr:Thyrotropin receptor [Bagarius yarrelli]